MSFTDLESKFDCFFKARGGLCSTLLDIEKQDVHGMNIYIDKIRSVHPKLPPIYLNIIDNVSLNATAGKSEEGYYFIGINKGLLYSIRDVFTKLHAYNNGHNNCDPASFNINLFNNGGIIEYDCSINSPKFFVDNRDMEIMIKNAELVTQFIVLHEVCHILRGHVDYFKNEFNAVISENDIDNNYEMVSCKQTLEMDADSFAVNRLLNWHLNDKLAHKTMIRDLQIISDPNNTKKILDNPPISLPELMFDREFRAYIFNFSYSLFSFFKIFGIKQPSLKSESNKSHPSASMRMNLVWSNLNTLLLIYGIEEKNIYYFIDPFMDGIKKSDKDFCKISFFEPEYDKFLDIISSKDTLDYTRSIMSNWGYLKSQLEKYTYTKLPEDNYFSGE